MKRLLALVVGMTELALVVSAGPAHAVVPGTNGRILFTRAITSNTKPCWEIVDAFARVWERWDAVSSMENPAGYLHRTAMNLFRSRYRRVLLATRKTIGGSTQPDAYEAVDDRQVALQMLRTLAPRQRAAILLTEVFRYTAEEAASMLGVRAATVRALHFQARASLKTIRESTDV
jgi:RNA polymerase sigma factor (sigma-70 family)